MSEFNFRQKKLAMDKENKSFVLRYVGSRFNGARLPLDVLSDLPAFRDLLVSYAKDGWRSTHRGRERLPKGFDKSISFDLVSIAEGSAMPKLDWSRKAAQEMLPGFVDELEVLVGSSYENIVQLIDNAGHSQFPSALSSEHVRALNKLGSGLLESERIEFLGSSGKDGNVVYLDAFRRKALIKGVRETYQARFEGVGKLVGLHVDGSIAVSTLDHGELKIVIDEARIQSEFDGNINSDVQFSLQIELDNNDKFRNVIEVYDIEIIDPDLSNILIRCNERLNELGDLQNGWHNGEGVSIEKVAIANAKSLLNKRPNLSSFYRIYPTLEGGVLFEFEKKGWDLSVEFKSTNQFEIFGVQLDGNREQVPKLFEDLETEFLQLFDTLTNGEGST